MIESFNTIKKEARAHFKDRNSRFIGLVFPVSSEEEIKEIQQNLRKEFYDARHHCYAYILGADKENFRANDDGEPSGSAGKPIYNQLLSAELTNVLAVVVRYFGGTKLGVPGLINAYKTATKMAIDEAGIKKEFIAAKVKLTFPYENINTAMQATSKDFVRILKQEFEMTCEMEVHVKVAELSVWMKNLERTGVELDIIEEAVIY
ncbi:MAG: YigZ family protein [Marinilabiliales bacterium]|nr:MAG: YigZ family protein [Marinilabiliales bacterium]